MDGRPMRIFGMQEKINKENENKYKFRVSQHRRVTFPVLVFVLHICECGSPKSIWDPTTGNEYPFMDCKQAQSQRTRLQEKEHAAYRFSHSRFIVFQF